MRFIIEKLKQRSMTTDEIFNSLRQANLIKEDRIGKRSVQNYLAELHAIGVVSLDPSSGIYGHAENEKQVFESKHDYQIALTHSKNLLFSNDKENTLRLDHTNPYLAVDILAYESERDADDFAMLQHLKTGYPDVYVVLQKYHQLMDETGLSKRACLPKLSSGTDFGDAEHGKLFLKFNSGLPKRPDNEPFPATLPNTLDNEVMEFNSGTLGVDEIIAKVPASKVKEILDLRDLLVGRIYYNIMNAVRNGTPLRGNCDFCPNRSVAIREK
jgi:hypothetical protein